MNINSLVHSEIPCGVNSETLSHCVLFFLFIFAVMFFYFN